ncbi:MAG: hypothetical protein GX802_04470 [Clostridiales bacterium]|nr:hypothetical protein [Clostridiales bacterium]
MLTEHTINLTVNYPLADCFNAIIEAVSTLSGYSVKSSSEITGVVIVKHHGLTLDGGGATITIEQKTEGQTAIMVRGEVAIPYYLAKSNCRKYATEIAEALTLRLKNDYKPIKPQSQKVQSTAEEKLNELQMLLDKKLITEHEYAVKRQQIIDTI